MVTIRILRIILLLIILSIPSIYIFIIYDTNKTPKRKLKKMRLLLEIEDRGEFFQRTREYMLQPYSSPLTASFRPDVPQDEQGIYDFYRYNYMENYRQRKGQSRIILPTLVAVAILGLIILLLVVDLSWLITAILFTTMIATVTFVVLLIKWQKYEFELMDSLEKKMSSLLEGGDPDEQ